MNFKLGKVFKNTDLEKYFHVGVSGGIRPIKNKNGLIIVLDVSSSPTRKGRKHYGDYFSHDGKYLYYFGINNKRGPEYYTGNIELRRSNEYQNFPLYLMVYTGPNNYIYAGQVLYTNNYTVNDGNWLFKLTNKSDSFKIQKVVEKLIYHNISNSFNKFLSNHKKQTSKDTSHKLLNEINKNIKHLSKKYKESPSSS